MHRHANFISIGENNVVIWPFINFSRWRPSAIINFLKFKILTANMVHRLNMHHRDKFCANRSNHHGDMAIVYFFNMVDDSHLGFSKIQHF